jgi:hypothetical protein
MASWALAAAGGATLLGASLALWHFLRDNFDEQRGRVGDAKHREW